MLFSLLDSQVGDPVSVACLKDGGAQLFENLREVALLGGEVLEDADNAGNFYVLWAPIRAGETRSTQPKGVTEEHRVLQAQLGHADYLSRTVCITEPCDWAV